jgi:hypothetical protein
MAAGGREVAYLLALVAVAFAVGFTVGMVLFYP